MNEMNIDGAIRNATSDPSKRELLTIQRNSMMTNKLNTMQIRLDPADLTAWRNGMLIQDALPYLTNEEREFLMTGMSLEEQELFFVEPSE